MPNFYLSFSFSYLFLPLSLSLSFCGGGFLYLNCLCPSINLFFIFPLVLNLSVYQSISLSVCPSVFLSICLSVCPSVCPSVHLSICLSLSLSVCLSVRPSVRPSVYLSIYLDTYTNAQFFPFIFFSLLHLSLFLSSCRACKWHACTSSNQLTIYQVTGNSRERRSIRPIKWLQIK